MPQAHVPAKRPPEPVAAPEGPGLPWNSPPRTFAQMQLQEEEWRAQEERWQRKHQAQQAARAAELKEEQQAAQQRAQQRAAQAVQAQQEAAKLRAQQKAAKEAAKLQERRRVAAEAVAAANAAKAKTQGMASLPGWNAADSPRPGQAQEQLATPVQSEPPPARSSTADGHAAGAAAAAAAARVAAVAPAAIPSEVKPAAGGAPSDGGVVWLEPQWDRPPAPDREVEELLGLLLGLE